MGKTVTDSRHSRLARSAGVVSIFVMISRILGLVREQVLTYFLETKTTLDAFYAAYTIPNFMRDLFAEGVLSKAFVSTFADVETKSGEKAAWRLANLVFNSVAIILVMITLAGIILSPFIVRFIFMGAGFDTKLPPESSFGFAGKRELTIYLTRIMFPYLLMVSMSAIAMGLLNSKGKFGIPASASAFFNVGSIIVGVAGYFIAPKLGLHPVTGMAVGVLVGGILQFLIQTPSMRRVGFRYKPILSFTDPDLKQVMKLAAPAAFGQAAMQVNIIFNRFFASQGAGWLAWVQVAFRVLYLPIGALGVAISTATLPVLSRLVAQNSMDEYKKTLSYSLKLVFILALPASVGLMVLSKPIISLLYERGEFSSDDTIRTAGALFYYSFGLCAYSGVKIATDGFYAIKSIRTPVIVSLFTIAFNIILNYIFIFQLGFDHRSLAASTACSITANFLLVFGLLWRRVGGFKGHGLALTFAKSLIASVVMGIAAALTQKYVSLIIGDKLSLLVAIFVAMVVLYGLYQALKVHEINQITHAVIGKLRR